MSEEITVGDVVVFKSGGPPMTVAHVYEGSNSHAGKKFATCQWFVNSEIKTREIDVRLIEKAANPEINDGGLPRPYRQSLTPASRPAS